MTITLGVITNPTADNGRGAKWGQLALNALANRGAKLVNLSRGSWQGAYQAAQKAHGDLDALVVVGGDGMVHLGAQVCATGRRKLPLGVIAAGSGNDAARTWGLPLDDIERAADAVMAGIAGDHTDVDVGEVRGAGLEAPAKPRIFTCVLSAGIDAAVAARGSALTFPRGPMKYKVATMQEIPRFKPYGVRVEAPGFEWEEPCALVAVANTAIFGGGLYATPHAVVNDGLLDVVVSDALSRLDILRIFPKLKTGAHIDDPRLHSVRVTKVSIAPSDVGAPLPAAFADGERLGPAPLDIAIKPGGLRVLGARLN